MRIALLITLLIINAGTLTAEEPKTAYVPDAFPTLVDPDCSHCRDEAKRKAGELREDDRVLAWIRGDYTGGAIPYRWFLNTYPVISDTYGVFVHDPAADFVRAWPASLNFRFHGWRNGILVMKRKDGTLFDSLTGLAIEGPGKGERLVAVPVIESNWGPWVKAHPGTVAYEMKPQFRPVDSLATIPGAAKLTRPAVDPRLDPETRVFGLSIGDEAYAIPFKSLSSRPNLIELTFNESKVSVLWDPLTQTAVSFAAETEGPNKHPVSLKVDEQDPSTPWIDETGSRWSIVGRAVSGPRQGESLKWLPGVSVKWYAWAASYPQTKIHP